MTARSPHVCWVRARELILADGSVWIVQDDGHPVRASITGAQRLSLQRGSPGLYMAKWFADRYGLAWQEDRGG